MKSFYISREKVCKLEMHIIISGMKKGHIFCGERTYKLKSKKVVWSYK